MNQKIVKELLKQLQEETQDPQDIGKLNITNIILWMKKQAYEPTTIQRVVKELKHLERNCNTSKPEEVKLYIANKAVSNARKENLIEAYNIAIQSLGLTWNKPFYQRQDKKRRAPKEELVQFIINHVKFPLNLKLKMSRDLGSTTNRAYMAKSPRHRPNHRKNRPHRCQAHNRQRRQNSNKTP